MTGWARTMEVEAQEYFGHWAIFLRAGGRTIRINCAAETAGRELMEGFFDLLFDGEPLDPERDE